MTALAVSRRGELYAGTSPHGKVYRIRDGSFAEVFDPKQDYIWALAFGSDGVLDVATGSPGRIFSVGSDGKGRQLWQSPDDHVRCLLADADGRLWAGTSGRGLLVRIGADGKASTVFDSQKTEIAAIVSDASGVVWAAALSAGHASASSRPSANPTAKAPPPPASSDAGKSGAASVTISTSFGPPPVSSAPPPPVTESSEVIRVGKDDAVTEEWKASDEIAFTLGTDSKGRGIMVGTGPKGALVSLSHRDATLLATLDEKEIFLLARSVLVTGSPSVPYWLRPAARGEFLSPVKDTGRRSRFGAFRAAVTPDHGSHATLAFRSGNSAVPDETWSDWSAPVPASAGTIGAPTGRFLQWKAALEGGADVSIDRIECAYENLNASPVVESIAASPDGGWEPGAPPNPSSAGSPGAGAIFAPPPERPPTSQERAKGLFLLTWKASDPDGDPLVYDLDVRPAAGGPWIPLRRQLPVPSFTFDPTLLPDGRYVFRVTASDRLANPDDPKADVRESESVLVDNTPPRIEVLGATRDAGHGVVRIRVVDGASALAQVWWSVGANPWHAARADDGLTDSSDESYRITLDSEDRGAFLLIRAVDAAGNVASLSLVAP